MKLHAVAAIVVLGISLSGCATIIQGVHQSVSVNTGSVTGAACTLKNSEGTWYATSPGSVDVHKTKNDLDVLCKKDGFKDGHAVSIAHFGGSTAGNILLGGVVGMGVDAASGANFYYDSPIQVDMVAADAPAPVPAAAATGTPVPKVAP